MFVLLAWQLLAQQPFYTDDADVTPPGKFHMEVTNQTAWLQPGLFPNLRQNTSVLHLNYGLRENLELGFDGPLIVLFNAPGTPWLTPYGNGDFNFGVKWKFHEARAQSRLPALTLSVAVEAPTGSVRKQLGSGVADVGFTFITQQSIGKGFVLHVNNGLLFSGNTLTGAVGIRAQGLVYTGGASVTRQITRDLSLGAELNGAAARTAGLGKVALQTQVGGSYALSNRLSFDFGGLLGRFEGSPRLGVQVGFTYDF